MPKPPTEDALQPASRFPASEPRGSAGHRMVADDSLHVRRSDHQGNSQEPTSLNPSRSRASLNRPRTNIAHAQNARRPASPSVRSGDATIETRSPLQTQSELRTPSYLAPTRSTASRLAASSPSRTTTPEPRAACSLRNRPSPRASAPTVSASQGSITPSNPVPRPAHRATHGTNALASPVLGNTIARRKGASPLHGNAAAAPQIISANPRTAHPVLTSGPGAPLHCRSQTTTPIPRTLVPTSTGRSAQNGNLTSESRPSRGEDVSSTWKPSAASARPVGATRTETQNAQKSFTNARPSSNRHQPAVNRISSSQKRTQPSATSSQNTRSRVYLPDTGQSVAPLSQHRVRASRRQSPLTRDSSIPTNDSCRPTTLPTDSSFTPSKEPSRMGTTDLGSSVSSLETTTVRPITGVPQSSPGSSYPGQSELMVDSPQHSLPDVLNGSLGLLATSTQSEPTSTAPVQNCPWPTSGVQFSVGQSEIHAGRDVGSGNFSLQGDGSFAVGNSNQINIHQYGPPNDYHKSLVCDISDKLRSYIVDDAVLSKDVHGDPSLCYEGTREKLLKRILSWVEGSSAQSLEQTDVSRRALCIVGAPGSGKSTIMNTLIVKLLDEAAVSSPGLISAHYCIRRSLGSTTDGTKIFPTISLQLCHQKIEVAKRVSQLLRTKQEIRMLHHDFLERLFIEAVKAHGETVFVIIDALDEASQPSDLAARLSRAIHSSPPNLRLLTATRNEHGVLQSLGEGLIPQIVHEIPTEKSMDEVGSYIAHRLKAGVKEIFGDDPAWHFWPDDSQLRSLSDRGGGLFIWARTAVDYILSRIQRRGRVNRDQWIEDVGTLGLTDVNNLYLHILKKQLEAEEGDSHEQDEEAIRAGMTGLFGFIIVAEDPFALDDLVGFLNLSDFDVSHFVNLARSILVPGTDPITGSTIPQMHKTFFDFIISERAHAFRIDIEGHHCKAADRCFEIMASQLKFNMAGLRSSFSQHGDRYELATSISPLLDYASTSWGHHLDKAGADQPPPDLTHVRAFLRDKLLFWLEILVHQVQVREAIDWLLKLGERLAHRHSTHDTSQLDLVGFTRDASMLLVKFSDCIESNIPHIYISFLAFSPGNSIVANHYRQRSAITVIPHPPDVPLQWDSWDADPKMAKDGLVSSVSFSPCGRHLAVGYDSSDIRVWNVETGECWIGPLKGHTMRVTSVCFSSDGLLIASGSNDKTIRVWDAETGKCMLGPLTGHTEHVMSVSFSPDSTHIASGSGDHTVRVWDVSTGDCVLGPLEGHTSRVAVVLYSPDGSCITSCSSDGMIWLWSPQTGSCIGDPLAAEHGSYDTSLALYFHPDGRRLVSGSIYNTIWIWDIQQDMCTRSPAISHPGWVITVCFSPDGRYIASGSVDCTICVWDTETATCVAGPIGGAVGDVISVAFSPDCRYLAAGSWNGIVRLWDFYALLRGGLRGSACEDQASTRVGITDYTVTRHEHGAEDSGGWTFGPNKEQLFWAPKLFLPAIWRPSTVRVLGRPAMIKPDLGNLVTGEEWLRCFPNS